MAIDGVYGELDTEATHEASSRSDTSEYHLFLNLCVDVRNARLRIIFIRVVH